MLIIYALLGALLGSLGSIVESAFVRQKGKQPVMPAERLVFSGFLNALTLVAIILIWPSQYHIVWVWPAIALLCGVGVLDTLYNVFFLKALQKSPISEINPIMALSPVATLIFSTFLPGTHNSPLLIIVLFFMVSSMYILKYDSSQGYGLQQLTAPFRTASLKLALAGAVFTGIAAVGMDIILENNWASEVTLLLIRMSIITSLAWLWFRPRLFPENYSKKHWVGLTVSTEIIYVVERIFKTMAIGLGNVSLAASVMSISPMFVLIFDAIFLKEKINKQKMLATLMVIVGLVIAALYI